MIFYYGSIFWVVFAYYVEAASPTVKPTSKPSQSLNTHVVYNTLTPGSTVNWQSWCEANSATVDDSSWTSITTNTFFINPQILVSLPLFGGSTYTSGFAFSIRIKDKTFSPGAGTSFKIKVRFKCNSLLIEY